MKSIILFRHGKSDWDTNYGSDHDRPLEKKGITSAKKMGNYLLSINQIPNKIISSTALRAKKTAEIALEYGKWNINISLNNNIYLCSTETLLSIVHQLDPKLDMVCLVGHEPTFSSFISESTNSIWCKFPTASMARIDFDIKRWKDASFGLGKLAWLTKPKELD